MGSPFWSLQEPSRVTPKITTCSFFTGKTWGDHKQKHQGGVGLVGLPPVGHRAALLNTTGSSQGLLYGKITPSALTERRPQMFKNCVCFRIKSTSARFAIIFNKSCALCKGGANCFPCWIWFLTKGCPLWNHGHFILVDKEMCTEQNDSSPCTDKCQTAICRCSWRYLGLPLGNNGFFFPSSFHRMILSHTCTAQNQASGIH